MSARRVGAGEALEWLRAHLCELCIQAAASEEDMAGGGFVVMHGFGSRWGARWSAQLCRAAGRGEPFGGDLVSAGFSDAVQVGRGADGTAWLPICLVPHYFVLWPHAAHAW